MNKEKQILVKLDNYKLGYYCQFIELGHVYSYLIDSRLNILKDDKDNWAIVAERLGYNPRIGGIMLDIFYYGNCLTNLENHNDQNINYYTVQPIEWESFVDTVDGDCLKPDAKFWNIRGKQIELSHNKNEYLKAGIELKEYEPGEISVEEVGRLLITKHSEIFRATDEEIYKSIPRELKKIFVIDEWYHRDYNEMFQISISDENLKKSFELNFDNENIQLDSDSILSMFKEQEKAKVKYNQEQVQNNRPSSYETWQMIAKVIAYDDINLYKPTLKPNTHWKNWPDSGSM